MRIRDRIKISIYELMGKITKIMKISLIMNVEIAGGFIRPKYEKGFAYNNTFHGAGFMSWKASKKCEVKNNV